MAGSSFSTAMRSPTACASLASRLVPASALPVLARARCVYSSHTRKAANTQPSSRASGSRNPRFHPANPIFHTPTHVPHPIYTPPRTKQRNNAEGMTVISANDPSVIRKDALCTRSPLEYRMPGATRHTTLTKTCQPTLAGRVRCRLGASFEKEMGPARRAHSPQLKRNSPHSPPAISNLARIRYLLRCSLTSG